MQKKYPIGGYAPGNYECKCCICGNTFIGDKRAVQCEPCAVAGKEKFDALSPEEQDEVIKCNAAVANIMFAYAGSGEQIVANQHAGMPIEEAIFQAGYTAGVDFERGRKVSTGAVSDDAHEKEAMMKGFDRVRKAFELRKWIMEGRGSYPYNDDRYKEEVRYLYDEVEAIIKETWADVKSKSFEYRQQIIAQYLKEKDSVNLDELWDEFSEYIDDDIDSLSRYAGSAVMTKEGWRKVCGRVR